MMMMQAELQSKMADVKNKQAEIQVKMQKVQLEQEELQLKKAEMFLKAQEMQDKAHMDVYSHQLDVKKAEIIHGQDQKKTDLDFSHKASQILADLYKHDNPQEKKESKPS